MNSWLFYALIGPLLWAVTNVADGALRSHFVKDDLALTWMTAVTRLPIAILFFLIAGIHMPDLKTVLLMFSGGVLWTFPMYFYYKAIEKEDPSRVALLLQLVPIFTLLIAFFALSERLTGMQGAAFAFLVAGGIFASLKRFEGVWRISGAFFLVALACFFWASSDVIFKKFEPGFPDFFSAFAVYYLGGFLLSFFIFFIPQGYIKVIKRFSGLPLRAWFLITATVTAGVCGSLSFAYALTLGKASLTAVLMSAQPLFVLGLGVILSLFIKEIRKEDLSRQALFLKGVSFAMILVGLMFLY